MASRANDAMAPGAGMSSMEGMTVELDFPLEFVVSGTAVSHQAKRRESVDRWKSRIRDATVEVLPEGHFATGGPVSVSFSIFLALKWRAT